jgi:hypothetical protein
MALQNLGKTLFLDSLLVAGVTVSTSLVPTDATAPQHLIATL